MQIPVHHLALIKLASEDLFFECSYKKYNTKNRTAKSIKCVRSETAFNLNTTEFVKPSTRIGTFFVSREISQYHITTY